MFFNLSSLRESPMFHETFLVKHSPLNSQLPIFEHANRIQYVVVDQCVSEWKSQDRNWLSGYVMFDQANTWQSGYVMLDRQIPTTVVIIILITFLTFIMLIMASYSENLSCQHLNMGNMGQACSIKRLFKIKLTYFWFNYLVFHFQWFEFLARVRWIRRISLGQARLGQMD